MLSTPSGTVLAFSIACRINFCFRPESPCLHLLSVSTPPTEELTQIKVDVKCLVFHPGPTTVTTVGGKVLMFFLCSALSLLSLYSAVCKCVLNHVELCWNVFFSNFCYLQPVLKIKDYRKYEMAKVNGWYPKASAML